MNKEEIFKSISHLNSSEFIVISGAAMVIRDIKSFTGDIDIAVSQEYYDFLTHNYKCELEKVIDGINIYYIGDINFSTRYFESEYSIVNGIKVQTPESILALKLKLNREKDKADIEKIKAFINK